MRSLGSRGLTMLAIVVAAASVVRADDEGDPSIPPVNPGGGYDRIFPNPTLPPNYRPHTGSSPAGVGSIANTQSDSIRLGQTFRASRTSLDWVAMVFQYNYQPNSGPMDAAQFRIHVASGLVTSGNNAGELINLIGSTGIQAVTPDPLTGDSLGWVRFDFPITVSLIPGNEYYLRVEHMGGYGVDNTGVGVAIGSLGSNTYSQGRRWRAIYNRFLDRWEQFSYQNEDVVFSLGDKATSLPGDYNQDGLVDAADYTAWRDTAGLNGDGSLTDGNLDGSIDALDYRLWHDNYSAVAEDTAATDPVSGIPEPSARLLALTCFLIPGVIGRRAS